MSYKLLTKCPVCQSKLKVIKLQCSKCSTVIENEFELSKFSSLSPEELSFIEVFIRCRGNIKDVEKELGISYPTVRARLDDAIMALGYNVEKARPTVSTSHKDILDLLDQGEITPDQAMEMINKEKEV